MVERAITATFSNWRPVMGRKVLQLIFEIPIEQQGEVLTMLGAPDEKWCAIALLKEKPIEDNEIRGLGHPPGSQTVPRPQADKAGKPPRPFSSLTFTEQAGIRSTDQDFDRFIIETKSYATVGDYYNDAADFIRKYCRVQSRKELTTDASAGDRWRKLNGQFEAWQLDQRYAQTRRA